MSSFNVYADPRRAAAYARLEFPGTYWLAFRDLPAIFAAHVRGRRALDFGCGTGRSTRFLRGLGFEVTGVDVADEMIALARERDPGGDYRRIADGDLERWPERAYDLALSAFTFDNVPQAATKASLLRALAARLDAGGRIVNLVSSPEIYTHEWASFSTRAYPENHAARAGDPVRIVMTDVEDRRPVVDVVWPDEAWRGTYRDAGLEVVEVLRPLGRADDGFAWVNETRIAPWTIYVLVPAR